MICVTGSEAPQLFWRSWWPSLITKQPSKDQYQFNDFMLSIIFWLKKVVHVEPYIGRANLKSNPITMHPSQYLWIQHNEKLSFVAYQYYICCYMKVTHIWKTFEAPIVFKRSRLVCFVSILVFTFIQCHLLSNFNLHK